MTSRLAEYVEFKPLRKVQKNACRDTRPLGTGTNAHRAFSHFSKYITSVRLVRLEKHASTRGVCP